MKLIKPVLAGAALLLMSASPPTSVADHWLPYCPHVSPHSHVYQLVLPPMLFEAKGVGMGHEEEIGIVLVADSNLTDCSGVAGFRDFVGNDAKSFFRITSFDGDYDLGIGGGFFGHGPWAHEPTCDYSLTSHGEFVTVNDVVFGSDIWFLIGADDTSGPIISVDPVTGETTCETSGSITPGDPTTLPTADADDCLTDVYIGNGRTCGAGGDGGYWVFLKGVGVREDGGNIAINNPPTAGSITA